MYTLLQEMASGNICHWAVGTEKKCSARIEIDEQCCA